MECFLFHYNGEYTLHMLMAVVLFGLCHFNSDWHLQPISALSGITCIKLFHTIQVKFRFPRRHLHEK